MLSIVGVWVVFSRLGWSLVFASWETSVIASDTKVPADLAGKIYFAGYTIFTSVTATMHRPARGGS